MDNQERREALEHLFHQPEWEAVVEMEREFRDDNIFKSLKVPRDHPNYAVEVAFLQGTAQAIVEIWGLRGMLRRAKNPSEGKSIQPGKPIKKGRRYEQETERDDDEDDNFNLDDQY